MATAVKDFTIVLIPLGNFRGLIFSTLGSFCLRSLSLTYTSRGCSVTPLITEQLLESCVRLVSPLEKTWTDKDDTPDYITLRFSDIYLIDPLKNVEKMLTRLLRTGEFGDWTGFGAFVGGTFVEIFVWSSSFSTSPSSTSFWRSTAASSLHSIGTAVAFNNNSKKMLSKHTHCLCSLV